MTCRSNGAWMDRAAELAQDVTHHLAHALWGYALPMTGAATGWYAWQWGVSAACLLAIVWEVIYHQARGWKCSVIGLLSFGAGAAVATVMLLCAGR